MIFDMKNYVPEVYSDSRDYRVLLRLFGLVSTITKYDVDSLIKLYNADECPDNLLPLLADLVGYKYNDGIPIDYNRLIIKNFYNMIRERGSEQGIRLAVALSINTSRNSQDSLAYSMESLQITYDFEKAQIEILYPDVSLIDRTLLEYVRPLGSTLKLTPASNLRARDDHLLISSDTNNQSEIYFRERHELNKSNIGFGQIKHDYDEKEYGRCLEEDSSELRTLEENELEVRVTEERKDY